jgi:hypothetical protein
LSSAWLIPVKKSLMIHQQVPNQCSWHGSPKQRLTEITNFHTHERFVLGVCYGQCLCPFIANGTKRTETQITTACAKTDDTILHRLWEKVAYWFDTVWATQSCDISLYYLTITLSSWYCRWFVFLNGTLNMPWAI